MTPLKQARVDAGKTLKQVSDQVGADVSHLSRIERAEDQASPGLAEKLAIYFNRAITEEQILYPKRFAKRKRTPRLQEART